MDQLIRLEPPSRSIRHGLMLLLFSLLGFSVNAPKSFLLFSMAKNPKNSAASAGEDYVLEVGDVIEVKLYYSPELNERVTIRPDGKVSFQLVNEIKAAGLTPAELSAVLVEKYSRLLRQPEVAVIVREFAGQKVFIGGEVVAPKVVRLNEGMTAVQAIMDAGGVKETAYLKEVVIVSRGPQGAPLATKVNLGRVVSGESPQNDVFLKPYDIVFVPKSRIAKINKFVEQYIRNLIPGTLTAGFSYAIFHTNQVGSVQVVPSP
jgi:polysaccharide export outer membrane protein